MQAFVPRLYLTPVRDEEAESQRKAKSRHARQTRRSTQGVTLTDLREAQRTNILSPQDREKEEGGTLDDRFCLKKGFTDDRRLLIGVTESMEEPESSLKWIKLDEEGNTQPRLETLAESPNVAYPSVVGSCGVSYCNSSCKALSAESVHSRVSGRLPQKAAKAEESRERQEARGEEEEEEEEEGGGTGRVTKH
ncbi:protein phosphatase 1 regulatory subunit 12A-like [Salarias fasciatus]|uniref:protein phosphatase 1 regulatory subunit 12A-like n=1 Tax=Salarias fasciatus TaxID=181472 RepID=UPI001176F930|nr:protein phosphatase 1 regulatory subunit 12A-like [Salarias fasciatus]